MRIRTESCTKKTHNFKDSTRKEASLIQAASTQPNNNRIMSSFIEKEAVEVPEDEVEKKDAAKTVPSSLSSSSPTSSSAGTPSKSTKGSTPTLTEYRHVAVYLGDGMVPDIHSEEPGTKTTRSVMYNAFPGDELEPHFFFPQSVTPMEPGKMYEVSARNSSSAYAIRNAKVVPIKLHSKGTPSAGEYVEIPPLTRDEITTVLAINKIYALVGILAAAPSKTSHTKDGRHFDLTTMLVHVLDDAEELHLVKIKMWGSAPADAKKGVAFRAIGLTKSEYKGDMGFEASKLTAITWGYKDPKDRTDARHVAKLKQAVANEEDDDGEVREVQVMLRPGAPRLSSAASSPAASKTTPKSSSSKKKARVEADSSSED